MTRSIAMELKKAARAQEEASAGFVRFFRSFRLPRKMRSNIEQTAARNRAERLFEVNFRSTWIR